jgi:hypothetical protein
MSALADVRPGERRGAFAAFLTLFGLLAAHTLLETARDALFLSKLPASQLPWVYLAMAAVGVALAQGPPAITRRLRGRLLSALLAASGLVTLGFWSLGSWTSPWTLRALYVWSGLVASLTTLQFWLTLGETYTITQAKRLYKLIALGSILGAVAGGVLARALAAGRPAEAMVLAAALLMFATGCGPALLLPRAPGSGDPRSATGTSSVAEAARLVRGNPYVARLLGFVLLSTVAVSLADYVFKSTVSQRVPAEQLGPFFATFYMVLNVLGMLAQLLVTGWLFRSMGLHRALWVYPALLALGAAGLAFGGGLIASLFLKGTDGTLRHSLHRTGTELLFLPIPDAVRSRAKPLVDVLGQRGGQALASVFILGEVSLNRGDTWLAAVAGVLCVAWIAWAVELRPLYLELFRAAVREGSLADRADLPSLDLGSLETLMAAMNSQDDAEVLGAMELLAAEGRSRLLPALILYHPSRPVVLRALELFEAERRQDFLPIADRLLSHPDDEVRAAALRARTSVAAEESALDAASHDPSPLVRATAVVGLVSSGWVTDDAQEVMDGLLRSGSPEALVALARAVERQPSPVFEEILLQLAEVPRHEVQSQAARAMGAVRSERFLPVLLPLLISRQTRPAAREAFVAHGEPALHFLDSSLADRGLPHEIRVHLPRTISRFEPQAAADVLQRHFLPEPDGMVRYKIIRGLNRIAADHPGLALEAGVMQEATQRTLEAALQLLQWRLTLVQGVAEEPRRDTPGHELLVALLRDKEVHAVERLFRLLGLGLPGEDLRRIYRGLRSDDPKLRAGSRELLENLLRPPLRDAVLALTDDVSDVRRLVEARPYFRAPRIDYDAVLAALLEQPSETVRCLAAYHVGELGLTALRGRLEAVDRRASGLFVAQVVEKALRMLDGASERLAHA